MSSVTTSAQASSTVAIAVIGASGTSVPSSTCHQTANQKMYIGFIGFRHLQHVLEEPTTILAAIVDVAPIGAELATKHGCPIYQAVPDMIADIKSGKIKVDGAILATPTASHVPLGLLLVKAGVHIIIEKPLSTDATNGKELVAADGIKGGKILVGHHRRFNPYIREVWHLMSNARIHWAWIAETIRNFPLR